MGKLWSLFLFASPLFAYTFGDAQAFLNTYCQSCHSGKSAAAGFNLAEINAAPSLGDRADRWTRIATRVHNSEMPPPRTMPTPPLDQRELFVGWVQESLHNEACAAGPVAGFNPIRRLNRDEYTATVRELLDIHLNVGHDLPADGAGGQGFDNAAEVLFLSPVLAEKYMDAAKQSLEFAIKDSRARARIGIVEPGAGASPIQAAHNILQGFLPRAFRRPTTDKEMEPFLALFREAQNQRQTFDSSVVYMLRGVLMSPQFLFRAEAPNPGPEPQPARRLRAGFAAFVFPLGQHAGRDAVRSGRAWANCTSPPFSRKRSGACFAAASRWASSKALSPSGWVHANSGREFVPDAKLFPNYASDAELQGDIRFQPIVFFHAMVANNAPVTDLIDSNWTIVTKKLAALYGLDKNACAKTTRNSRTGSTCRPDSHRGGLLGMSAVLAVSSYPYRTSPVLRGKWVLDSILGTPPPPPPPNVPALEEHQGAAPQTMRERLAQHRANPVCASCHSRIDPDRFRARELRRAGPMANGRRGQADRQRGRTAGWHEVRRTR